MDGLGAGLAASSPAAARLLLLLDASGAGDAEGILLIAGGGYLESAWLSPCKVLVINDNLYGLMFVLSYICKDPAQM